ncbi:MAG: hypothetical protein ACYDGY_06085 [Acidimicrobiales bacterium]
MASEPTGTTMEQCMSGDALSLLSQAAVEEAAPELRLRVDLLC